MPSEVTFERMSHVAMGTLTFVMMIAMATNVCAQESPGRIHVDGVAVLVGGRSAGPDVEVILRSDIEARVRLSDPVFPLRPISERAWTQVRDQLIGEALIVREARRAQMPAPAAAAIASERERLIAGVGATGAEADQRLREFLAGVGMDEAELAELAERRAIVRAFLDANLEDSVVSDAEVERVYELGHHPFVGQSLADARDPIRVWLAVQATTEALSRWVAILRSRTPIRLVAAER